MDDESKKPPVGESFGEGKLWIKLNFPKAEETELTTEAKPDDQVRICDICNREFINGKALGGHMRVHVQEKNKRDNLDYKMSKNNPVRSVRKSVEKSQHLVNLSEKPNCPLCGKGFPSIKSLFGHMRCHPEREYRGICPPQTGLKYHLSSSSSVSDEREDLSPSLPKWSAKAKRGRCSLIASGMSSSEEDECFLSEEDKEAVFDLMSLAHGKPFVPGSSLRSSKGKMEVTNSNSLVLGAGIGCKDQVFESKKRRFRDLGYGSFEGKGKGKVLFASSENSLSDNEFEGKDSDGSVSSDELITNLRGKKKKAKLRNLKSVENDGEEDDKNVVEKGPLVYKCSTCNKCFPSHQALGGHRSSHTKPKLYAKQALDSESALVNKSDNSPDISDEKKYWNTDESVDPIPFVQTHQCTLCPKSFATGQALGGHMRCHWTGPGPTEGPSSSHVMSSPGQMGLVQSSNAMSSPGQIGLQSSNAISSPGQIGLQSSNTMSSPGEEASRTRGLGLDLNELPLIEDEDGGVESQNANGMLLYGDDFSSHNSAA